ALLSRLDDHDRLREAADDAIATREMPILGSRVRRKLSHQQTLRGDLLCERSILRRVDTIDPGPEHGDRLAAAFERAAVRGGINAARESAHDHDSGEREVERNIVSGLEAVARRVARTDHRNRDAIENRAIAAGPDARWRVGNHRQQLRVFLMAQIDDTHAEITGRLSLADDEDKPVFNDL